MAAIRTVFVCRSASASDACWIRGLILDMPALDPRSYAWLDVDDLGFTEAIAAQPSLRDPAAAVYRWPTRPESRNGFSTSTACWPPPGIFWDFSRPRRLRFKTAPTNRQDGPSRPKRFPVPQAAFVKRFRLPPRRPRPRPGPGQLNPRSRIPGLRDRRRPARRVEVHVMLKPRDVDTLITSDADPDDTGAIDTQAMGSGPRRLDPGATPSGASNQRPAVRRARNVAEILYCLVGGYTLRDIHAALIELTIFKGTLATFRRHAALERKRHPRLSPTVQDRILADFPRGRSPAHRRLPALKVKP